jgi:hypothetical protein
MAQGKEKPKERFISFWNQPKRDKTQSRRTDERRTRGEKRRGAFES